MNRRTVIKQIAISSAAAFLFPSCFRTGSDPQMYVKFSNLELTPDDKELVGLIADVIIPETDTPGGRKLEADTFTLVMVDDCLAYDDQQKYLRGMRSFVESVQSLTDASFLKADPSERQALLQQVQDRKDNLPEDVVFFYARTRQYVVQAYVTSQHFMTHVKEYQLIPGPNFRGCAPADNRTLA